MTKGIFRPLAVLALGAVLCLLPAGCQTPPQGAETTVFAMDTVMRLTAYGAGGQQAIDQGVEQLYALEAKLSVTRQDSFLSALNQAGPQGAQAPDQETLDLLSDALDLCALTGGALDITAYPAVRAWGFTTGEYRVPDREELEQLAGKIDYTAVEVDRTANRAALPQGMELDLGAVAKGCAGDRLSALFRQAGVTSALLDLGQSTIQAVGARPDGSPWRIGIQDPWGEGYLGVLELTDRAMGTSGGYQRYFEQDGQRYWHIIDPDTAAPARTGLASVTVIGPSGLVCDGLSTALFVMGAEEGTRFWRDHPELDIEVLFMTDEGELLLTPGLEGAFSLAQSYEDWGVTVLS